MIPDGRKAVRDFVCLGMLDPSLAVGAWQGVKFFDGSIEAELKAPPANVFLMNLCIGTMLVALLLLMLLINYLVGNRPTAPHPEVGLIYPLSAHGPPVFISLLELGSLLALGATCFGTFLLGLFLQRDGRKISS